ncbi:MAG: ABC transporter permease [Chloroflexota bacterium]
MSTQVLASGRPSRRATGRRAIGLPFSGPLLLRWLTLVILIGVWQLVASQFLRHNTVLAPPSAVVRDGLPVLWNGDVLAQWVPTTERFLMAFGLTAVFGVLIGMALGRTGQWAFAARDVVYVLYTLPLVPFYPLFVLWAGIGAKSEVAFGVAHGIVPVILTTMSASALVDPVLLSAAHSMGASPWTRLRTVVLPAILPDIVGALRVGASLSLLGVLLAELMISVDGIGNLIQRFATSLNAPALDATILVVSLGAILINAITGLVERRFGRWRST